METGRVTRGGISGESIRVHVEGAPIARHWRDIRHMLETAALPGGARSRALAAFELLATVEARIHGTDIERVHFHEVGATDSIMDMVGVSLGLEVLRVERLISSAVALGSGTVTTSHGVLPVPAPATLEMLTGVPIESGAASGELTTPTGAALIATCADAFGPMPHMTVTRLGYGAGSRDIPGMPNVARIAIGHELAQRTEPAVDEPQGREDVVMLESTIDHLSPEHVAFAAEEIRAAGALDVWQVPAAMKKGRLAVELRVLALPQDADALERSLHELTGTLGVRRTPLTRSLLERRVDTLEGPWGPFRVKVSGEGPSRRVRPEHADIARVARERGVGYAQAARELTQHALESLKD
ncbi:MAG: nickel pincer cofactor biosynthesis protein LarC [Coriobacteriia bacterium]